jgi:hypothetical protein
MKSTLALALALGLSSSVLAATNPGAGLQQKGTPEAKAGTLSTYGIEVPVRTALKSLVPTGWRLFVHKSATLPSSLSWKPGDAWTEVLSNAALHADLAALVDWDTRTVLIRTREVALQESAVRTEIAQAASTPLPRFGGPQGAGLATHKPVPAPGPGAASLGAAPASLMDSAPVTYAFTPTPVELAAAPVESPAPVAAASQGSPSSGISEPLAAELPSATAEAAQVEERAPTPLAMAVVRAVNEQSASGGPKPRYTVDDGGNIVATDAFTALAAATTLPEPAPVAVEPSAAATATLQALFSRPVERATPALTVSGPAPSPAEPLAAPLAVRATAQAPVLADAQVPPAPAASSPAPRGVFEQVRAVEASPPLTLVTQAAAPVALPLVPVFRVNPTREMVKDQEASVAAKPARLSSTPDFTYTAPVALNKAPAKAVAQAIANRFNLRLVWLAPDLKIPGPVTLMSDNADQDIALFQKAMGLYAPVTLERSVAGDLRVVSKDTAFVTAHTAAAAKAAQAVAQVQSTEYLLVAEESARQGGSPAVAPKAVPMLQLTVEQGDSLESAVKRFVQVQGYTHEWKVSGGFDANRNLTFEGDTLTEVLSQVLPSLGVSADIYTTDKHIVIRPGDYRE